MNADSNEGSPVSPMPAPAPSRMCQLDHAVIAVHDLARASEDFRALGFTVTPGGEHPGRTSHNALVVFDDGAYIEIIAWRAPAPQERWWRTLQAHGEGLVDHALLPGAVGPALAAAHARGLDTLRGPIPGGRHRPDGTHIAWESARHDTPDVPFLCADLTPRALRVPEGAARRHANGATGAARVRVAAQDLERSAARWRALLGPQVPVHVLPGTAGMGCVAYRLGATDFELFGPRTAAGDAPMAVDPAASDQARDRLARHGEGPFALQLHAAGAARRLDPALSHGVPIMLGTDGG